MNLTLPKGQYDTIKSAILAFLVLIMGPATYAALMSAIDDGDTTKYLMVMGLLVVSIVLILVYRLISIEEAEAVEHKPDPDVEKVVAELKAKKDDKEEDAEDPDDKKDAPKVADKKPDKKTK